ncbi:MAG TPA: ABC transporter ATP-binding protein [Bacteroidia bacterium]|nr:ABC transporter ATP-binding protein [Bacteroidota bacterium]MBP9790863.1 ABC transporter ATP-binding protein [Bacteroidia bacterium]MBK7430161.1 ABC transporter ATP-binding protein [Bacteroidota bacterium]MBK8587185.1 ABC transporter ATP-binding protein [Bacteroidota bacterium]HQV99376.1 ABC transporter ATP-binding protein [Bacteroidia bacterium]
MSKETVVGKAFDMKILRRIYAFTKPYKKKFYLSVGLTLLLAFLSPLRPILIQYTVDEYIIKLDEAGLGKMMLLMIALLLFQTFIQYIHTYLTNWLGQTVIKDLRVKLFRHIAKLRLKYFDHTPIGTLVTRTISDLETIADIFSEGLIVIIGDLLQLAVIIAVMFYKDWRLTLISLCTIPILMVATRIFQYGINKTFREVRTQVAALNTFVQEHITGMSIVQIFNREEEEMKRFRKINNEHMKANVRSVWYYSIFFPVVELLSAASIGLLVWWGSGGVITHDVSLGNVIAFIMFINMLFRPIRELADKFNTLQMGMVSSERVLKVLDTEEFIEDKGTLETEIKGSIRFENVWFAYNEAKDTENTEWILKDVSFEINAGETLALIGATGAGKSSIINLVGRMYEFQKGRIMIDGIDIRNFNLNALRKQVAVVLQDVFLFSDTIYNNITLNDNTISLDKVKEASQAVGANVFIDRLPGKYDFNVMERGAMLSVGQRQLISFIRAYVFKPSILILDEATSSIDSESEELIQKATATLTKGRTSIVIAHRLATIQNADKIIVMDHGKVIEQGNHQELLKQDGLYKELYDIQFRNS